MVEKNVVHVKKYCNIIMYVKKLIVYLNIKLEIKKMSGIYVSSILNKKILICIFAEKKIKMKHNIENKVNGKIVWKYIMSEQQKKPRI